MGKDVPKIGKDPDDIVSAFITKYITAVIPPIAPEIENHIKLMENLQKHIHSDYFHRNKSCCFGFPIPPATKTLIPRPPIDDKDEIIENAKSMLQTVQNTLTADIHNISTQHLLQDINLDQYGCIEDFKKRSKCHFAATPTRCFEQMNAIMTFYLYGEERLTCNMSLMKLQQ